MDTDIKSKRGGWGSNFGFLMASIGSAVGLGNIWGFPYKMGKSGGAVFLLFYLVLVVLVGVTVMLGELALGRRSGKSGVSTHRALSKKVHLARLCRRAVRFLHHVLLLCARRHRAALCGGLLPLALRREHVCMVRSGHGLLRLFSHGYQEHDSVFCALHPAQHHRRVRRRARRHREVLQHRHAGAVLPARVHHCLHRLPARRCRGLQVHVPPRLLRVQ